MSSPLTFQDKLKEKTLRTFKKTAHLVEEDSTVAFLEKSLQDEKKRHEEFLKYIKGVNSSDSKPPSQLAKLISFLEKCQQNSQGNLAKGFSEIKDARNDVAGYLDTKTGVVGDSIQPEVQRFVDEEIATALNQRKDLKDAGTLVDVKERKHSEAVSKGLPTASQLANDLEKSKTDFFSCQESTLATMNDVESKRTAHLMQTLISYTQAEMEYHQQCFNRLQQIAPLLQELEAECSSITGSSGIDVTSNTVTTKSASTKKSGFGFGSSGKGTSSLFSNNRFNNNNNNNSSSSSSSSSNNVNGGGSGGPQTVSQRIANLQGGNSSNSGESEQQESSSGGPRWITKPFFVKHNVHVDTNFEWSGKDPTKQFELLNICGKGAYGAVYRAMHSQSGSVIAIKVLSETGTEVEELQKEIDILKKCRSDYIVSYYGSFHNVKDATLWIMMDFCDGGSVRDIIEKFRRCGMVKNKTALTEEQVAALTLSCVRGLAYLHENNIMHRDVKCGNVLLNKGGECKLTDFGVSTINQSNYRTSIAGTLCFMAPEMLDINYAGYDYKADIWSLGISMFEMIEGNAPNEDLASLQDATNRIVGGKPPRLSNESQYSEKLVDFLDLCLTQNPKHRPTAAELATHPFVTEAESNQSDVLADLVTQYLTASSN